MVYTPLQKILLVVTLLGVLWVPACLNRHRDRVLSQGGNNPIGNTPVSELLPPLRKGEIWVHIVGAVRKPGLYRIPGRARVMDAIQIAGGPLPEADLNALNLAGFVNDGEQIRVPFQNKAPETLLSPTEDGPQLEKTPNPPPFHPPRTYTYSRRPPSKGSKNPILSPLGGGLGRKRESGHKPSSPQGVIHINTASSEQLEQLPGIGPAIAQRIVEYRNQNGPFVSLEQLMEVQGIGPKKFALIKPYIAL